MRSVWPAATELQSLPDLASLRSAVMAFWQENYSFIKDVYETRITKMIEWMDHLEMAISKVCLLTQSVLLTE